jgi:hypothetical protein
LGADHRDVKTRTLPPASRLAVLLALPLAALAGGCGAGANPEPASGPAAAITAHTNRAPSVTGPLPTVGTTIDLDGLDADLAEIDAHLSEADRDLATPEGDF